MNCCVEHAYVNISQFNLFTLLLIRDWFQLFLVTNNTVLGIPECISLCVFAFVPVEWIPRYRISGSHSMPMFIFTRKCQIALQNCYTNLPSQSTLWEFPFPYILPNNWYCQILTIGWLWKSVWFSKFALVNENNFLAFIYYILIFIYQWE